MMITIVSFYKIITMNLIANKQQDLQKKDEAQKQRMYEFILGNPIGKNPTNLRIEMIASKRREKKKRREKSF